MAEMNSNGRAAGRVRLRSILCCLGIGALFASLQAAPADRQLETITVEAKRQLEHQVDQFVQTVVVHHFGEALMRWDTAVCPLPLAVALPASPRLPLRGAHRAATGCQTHA
jgi:hypothetical protein